MKKTTLKKLTHWLLTAVFLALVAGLSLLDQPRAMAQGSPGVTVLNGAKPFRHPSSGQGIQTPQSPLPKPEPRGDSPQIQSNQESPTLSS